MKVGKTKHDEALQLYILHYLCVVHQKKWYGYSEIHVKFPLLRNLILRRKENTLTYTHSLLDPRPGWSLHLFVC